MFSSQHPRDLEPKSIISIDLDCLVFAVYLLHMSVLNDEFCSKSDEKQSILIGRLRPFPCCKPFISQFWAERDHTRLFSRCSIHVAKCGQRRKISIDVDWQQTTGPPNLRRLAKSDGVYGSETSTEKAQINWPVDKQDVKHVPRPMFSRDFFKWSLSTTIDLIDWCELVSVCAVYFFVKPVFEWEFQTLNCCQKSITAGQYAETNIKN